MIGYSSGSSNVYCKRCRNKRESNRRESVSRWLSIFTKKAIWFLTLFNKTSLGQLKNITKWFHNKKGIFDNVEIIQRHWDSVKLMYIYPTIDKYIVIVKVSGFNWNLELLPKSAGSSNNQQTGQTLRKLLRNFKNNLK